MKTYFEEVAKDVYGFLLWDDSWNSYNNCYLLRDNNDIILIDSGKEVHSPYLITALNSIGISNLDITKFIVTHGHQDHLGGSLNFHQAKKFIHPKDLDMCKVNFNRDFILHLPDRGMITDNLECILLGHHTSGSVAIFDHKSEVLFCGDHLCFFGDPLPDNKLIVEGHKVKDQLQTFIYEWSKNIEMREKYNFELFVDGLKALVNFNAKFLCTGHGVIIEDNISSLIKGILDNIDNTQF